jgi:hypothetical protein
MGGEFLPAFDAIAENGNFVIFYYLFTIILEAVHI